MNFRSVKNVTPGKSALAEYGPIRDFTPAAQTTTLDKPDPWLIEHFLGRSAASGVKVTPLTAMGVSTVYGCVNAISRPLAMLPVHLYRRRNDGGEDLALDHPAYSLLHDAPNEEMTSSSFRRALFANAALRQQGFGEILRDGMGDVFELWPIANACITPMRDSDNSPLYYNLKGDRVDKSRILHIKGLTFDGILGADLVVLAREAIGVAIALADHAARYFPNASSPTLVASSPLPNLTKEQIQQIKDEIYNRTSGSNAHKALVLGSGATVKSMEVSDNAKGQFIEAQKFQEMAICRFFGVPPVKAGITEDAHYNNVWAENESFITDCLLPWAVEAEQTFNMRLLSKRERGRYYFKFNFEGLLRGDPEKRAAFYDKMVGLGVMSRNEVRRKENLNPVAGGDEFMISQNLQMLDSTGKPVPKPTQQTA